MRNITPATAAALSSSNPTMVMLVEMLLSAPVRMAGASVDIVFEGNTYFGTGDLGAVDPIDDSPGEIKSMRFGLSGVPTDLLAIAMQEEIRGKLVTVRLAVLDSETHAVVDAPVVWAGTMDQMPISVGKDSAMIGATAEHRGSTFARTKPLRYTDVDQQRLYPGDTCMRFVVSQANHEDVWPAAAFWRKN